MAVDDNGGSIHNDGALPQINPLADLRLSRLKDILYIPPTRFAEVGKQASGGKRDGALFENSPRRFVAPDNDAVAIDDDNAVVRGIQNVRPCGEGFFEDLNRILHHCDPCLRVREIAFKMTH
ncbi:MAG TPA: hypothetical protein PK652_02105 [Smithellaceae bacterium]|nr:hypothetical protein [Smithellaceae bacterium]